jgi:hypothetical protein
MLADGPEMRKIIGDGGVIVGYEDAQEYQTEQR